MPHDARDQLVDFVRSWSDKTEIAIGCFLLWIGIATSKFYDWKARFGKVNEHNAWVPRDHWLTDDEKQRIGAFARANPLEGYRRLTFMMLDADQVACSPASTYRVLKAAGLLAGQAPQPTKKGTGFVQPLKAHEHWHTDISFLNIAGTFYFLGSVLDGYSRSIVHWEIRETMKEPEMEIIIQRAREAYPGVTPRIISDNGPQFIAKDFKEFIRLCGMTHVKTSPYYPQSNGKIERFHKTIKSECIRTKVPLSLDDARRVVTDYVAHYNNVRLHSAISYLTPKDKLAGRDQEILDQRDLKLAEARERRKNPNRRRRVTTRCHRRPVPLSTSPRSAPPSPWQPSCNCSASPRRAAQAPNAAAPVPATAPLPAPVAASPSTSTATTSTASSAAAPAMLWTFGPRPLDNPSTTPRWTCANAWPSRYQPCPLRPGTEKRNP